MKLLITVALLSIAGFLFAQNDTPTKKIPVTVFKDGKAVGVKLISPNADSLLSQDTSHKKTGGFVSISDTFKTKMTFWDKCKYFIISFKRENAFMFWSLVLIIGFWVMRIIFKLFDR